ncbi:DUF6985 domain-containing protein [Undibacterium terreum]|uniref:DUF6985 domain-containing protein n=1 Tax=Undibacterium terreum TaxID=1224302 RepID=A0A916U4V0_9BURK|nr:hypothetical protein [Undibacterium terreum]GGC60630.1 hypothetical protein GCM10011396_04450 [Undibacterium terreum]
MLIEQLGALTKDEELDDWLISAPVAVPYLGGIELEFVLEGMEDDAHPEEFASAVASFLAKNKSEQAKAAPHLLEAYRSAAAAIVPEKPACEIRTEDQTWPHVRPEEVRVCRRQRGDRKVYVQVVADCDWDHEHGLQLVFREGKQLSRVSSFDDHLTYADAFGLPDDMDQIS